MLSVMNPYRMPKPKAGVLFKANFCYADHKGRIDDTAGVARLCLTTDYLWVNDNLTIPLASVLDVHCEKGKVVCVSFYNALVEQEQALWLSARNWVGLRDKALNGEFASRVESQRHHAARPEAFAAALGDETSG
jgi:hypothetical protein